MSERQSDCVQTVLALVVAVPVCLCVLVVVVVCPSHSGTDRNCWLV